MIAVILAIGAGLVFWKIKAGGHGGESLNRVTKEDMALLLADADPSQLKTIGESPDAKKKIAENIKQLLAVASQARKDGLADDPNIKLELESIRSVVTASLYDKKINEGKGPMPPFSFITEDQIKEFTAKPAFETEFKAFLDSKIALAKESGRFPKDKELTEEEINGAKEDFAKIKIYEVEAEAKKKELGEGFERNLDLQIKLQQAQFLATRYAQKNLAEKAKVTDDDVKKYIAENPQYSTAEKKTQAEQILSRAKAGEDFAKLSDEFSQDPGTKGKGGLYEGVTMGKMVPAFEQAAVALARQRDDARSDFAVIYQWPLKGRISGVFGSQRIYNGEPRSPHSGLDVAAATGTLLRAPAGGVVIFAEPALYLTGGTILLDHGHGVSSVFLHLSRIKVQMGQRVAAGQVLGDVGATGRASGPHMHWGLNWFDVRLDPSLLPGIKVP